MRIIDTTLREGEQTAGVFFDYTVKKRIIDGLVQLGVDEIELGVASSENRDLVQLTKYLRTQYPAQAFSLWCRCRNEDIRYAVSLRPSVLALSIPASDLHLSKKIGKDRKWAMTRLRASLHFAAEEGANKIAVGLEDASRADTDFLFCLGKIAGQNGAFRLRLADTVGVASPLDIIRLMDELAGIGMELGLHCHNDFGMATANTITGMGMGAKWVDATILGLGERAGNGRLEEIISYLVLQKGRHYNLTGLASLSRYVASQVGRQIGPARPILGEEIFACETGLHLQGLMADPATYEPFPPEKLGKKRKIYIGQKAGRRSIAATLMRLGLSHPDEENLTNLTRNIRRMAFSQQRALTDHEITDLARAYSPSI